MKDSVNDVDLVSTTVLDEGVETEGTWIHTAKSNVFLTLYISKRFSENDDSFSPDNGALFIIINTGFRKHPLRVDVTDFSKPVLRNYPVYIGEETWISSSAPDKHIVYGFSTTSPFTI